MSSFATVLLSYLLLYKYALIYGIFFLSAAIILPIPDNTILLAAGAFSNQGYFNFWLSLAAAVAGCMCGDLLDYFLARRFGLAISNKLRLRIPPSIEAIERYVRTHPGRTIFLTRFVGTFDVLVDLLAGYAGVSLGQFLLADFLGNLVSNALVLMGGYALGDYWMAATNILSTIGWILLALFLIAILLIATRNTETVRHLRTHGRKAIGRVAARVMGGKRKNGSS